MYERDIPEVPLVVDRYEDHLHLAEFNRPHERTIAEHADWLDLMAKTAAEVMEIRQENVFVKHRNRQRGSTQYEKVSREGRPSFSDQTFGNCAQPPSSNQLLSLPKPKLKLGFWQLQALVAVS